MLRIQIILNTQLAADDVCLVLSGEFILLLVLV